ncbi:MAG: 8-amino-7-oxononanoate synthase [Actinomycetota bacterium]|nr:8-amino-7-oxononanoate synthase [Actinomycetota bacterium]
MTERRVRAPEAGDEATDPWDTWVSAQARAIADAGRWRTLRGVEGGGTRVRLEGRFEPVISFASNDYLGLAHHPLVRAAAAGAADRFGAGVGSSRLVAGERSVHRDLEAALAEWSGSEAALVFPTGYQANLAVLATFGHGARIVSDALNHASIVDGARLARGEVAIYRHGDADHAADLIASAPDRAVVVTDTVFSMDGDVAPIAALSAHCARHHALLVLDDAHAVLPVETPDPQAHVLRVGSLSKAFGSQGGYVTGPRPWIDLVVNKARTFVYTTGLSPADAAAAAAAIAVCRSEDGERLRQRLRSNVDRLRPAHSTPIIPIVIGGERQALHVAEVLLDQGLFVPTIRPPTVPAGSSRLRISLSAAHCEADVTHLARALAGLGRAE